MRFEIFPAKPNWVADIVRMTSDVLLVAEVLAQEEVAARSKEPDRGLHAQVGVADVIENVDHHDEIEALGSER